jgi:hypothetical protein
MKPMLSEDLINGSLLRLSSRVVQSAEKRNEEPVDVWTSVSISRWD